MIHQQLKIKIREVLSKSKTGFEIKTQAFEKIKYIRCMGVFVNLYAATDRLWQHSQSKCIMVPMIQCQVAIFFVFMDKLYRTVTDSGTNIKRSSSCC